jgi:hypothetical protein
MGVYTKLYPISTLWDLPPNWRCKVTPAEQASLDHCRPLPAGELSSRRVIRSGAQKLKKGKNLCRGWRRDCREGMKVYWLILMGVKGALLTSPVAYPHQGQKTVVEKPPTLELPSQQSHPHDLVARHIQLAASFENRGRLSREPETEAFFRVPRCLCKGRL